MPEYSFTLGGIVPHNEESWRVVRIIHQSETLFEAEDGQEPPYIAVESYVQLKSPDGRVDFVALSQEKKPYEGPASIIKGIEPIPWGPGGRKE